MGGTCGSNGGEEVYVHVIGNQEEKRPLGRPRRRWIDNIKTPLVRIVRVNRTGLVWLRISAGGELLWTRQ
jgi:hypothetical protein